MTSKFVFKAKLFANTNIFSDKKRLLSSLSAMLGLSGLDRKAMEQSRLARLAQKHKEQITDENDLKRKRRSDTSPSRDNRLPIKKSKLEPFHIDYSTNIVSRSSFPTPYLETKSFPTTKSDNVNKRNLGLSNRSFHTILTKEELSGVQYPNGVVKKTWVRGFPRLGDDISIEEVLQKNDLTLAVLGAFQIDPEWIMGKLDPQTRVHWVLQAKTESEKRNLESQASSNYKFCFPSMKGRVNCMHSKLQLLAHPSHLRIVVPTANLTSYDWGETGVMENMCFIIDLPRHKNAQSSVLEDLTHFGQELIYFLEAQGLPEQVIKSVLNFDFSRTAKIGFVHSIGGAHTGDSWKRTGYCGLASTVQKLGIQNKDPIKIDFVTASLGNLTPRFIKSIYLAAQGSISEITPKKLRESQSLETENELQQNVTRFCRVYFPTRETVEKSIGGVGAAGTICFNSRWWTSNHFLQRIIRDCHSRREGMLMHSKIWFVRPHEPSFNRQSWAYVGSANLSESAWGQLVTDTKTRQPKLHCANWECGVIFPVTPECGQTFKCANEEMAEFIGFVPIPMVIPGPAYAGREPWFFNDRR